MPGGRSYADSCGTAHALELVGERWALLIVRELMLGPKRYSDLLADLPGISTNVLSTRLGELESTGILRRARLPPPAASSVYELTDWGRDLEPVICHIGRWAARSPRHDTSQNFSVTSFVLSLRANAHPDGAEPARIQFLVNGEAFVAELGEGHFGIERGASDRTDAVVSGSPPTLAAIVYGGLPVSDALAQGLIQVTGNADAFQRFARAFPLPEKASG